MIAVSCSADRQGRARIDSDAVWPEQLEPDPALHLADVTEDELADDVVRLDLNQPMDALRTQLAELPVTTRLSLTGTRLSLTGPMVVARDPAHAKLARATAAAP